MPRTARRALLTLVGLLAGTVVASPWLVYEIGLFNVIDRPVPPNAGIAPTAAERVWLGLKETGPIKAERLNPYSYAFALVKGEELPAGGRVAWFVARNHNSTNLRNNRMLWWHVSGAALTVWLTRNWTTEQLIAKAQQVLGAQSAASNNALLTDTYTSPLRVQHGAAKRGR